MRPRRTALRSGGFALLMAGALNALAQDYPVLSEIKDRLDGMGTEETTNASPQEFAALVKRDIEKYAKVVKAAGLRID